MPGKYTELFVVVVVFTFKYTDCTESCLSHNSMFVLSLYKKFWLKIGFKQSES